MKAVRHVTGARLLGLPVRLGNIELGRPVDVVIDVRRRRALGLEVRCGDASHRFLALSVARVGEEEVAVRSPEGPAVIHSVPCRFVPLVGEEGYAEW